jgi:hypothetical protein
MKPYPDEPNPDNEYEWKKWWIGKMFRPEEPLYSGQLDWVHDCWKETKATLHEQSPV